MKASRVPEGWGEYGDHLAFRVAVGEKDVEAGEPVAQRIAGPASVAGDEGKLTTFLQRKDVFSEERGLFAGVRADGPVPVAGAAVEAGVRERRDEQAVGPPDDCAAHVVEVEVGEQDVGDVRAGQAEARELGVERGGAMEVVVAEEFGILLVT